MPNWCSNKLFVKNLKTEDQDLLLRLFDQETFCESILPQPDWANTPNEKGELPLPAVLDEKHPELGRRFPDGTQDDRWYSWRNENWGTKWDVTAQNVEIEYEDDEQLEMSFETAWAPPEPICYRLREMFQDLSISWFYDEPGMETAGYL